MSPFLSQPIQISHPALMSADNPSRGGRSTRDGRDFHARGVPSNRGGQSPIHPESLSVQPPRDDRAPSVSTAISCQTCLKVLKSKKALTQHIQAKHQISQKIQVRANAHSRQAAIQDPNQARNISMALRSLPHYPKVSQLSQVSVIPSQAADQSLSQALPIPGSGQEYTIMMGMLQQLMLDNQQLAAKLEQMSKANQYSRDLSSSMPGIQQGLYQMGNLAPIGQCEENGVLEETSKGSRSTASTTSETRVRKLPAPSNHHPSAPLQPSVPPMSNSSGVFEASEDRGGEGEGKMKAKAQPDPVMPWW